MSRERFEERQADVLNASERLKEILAEPAGDIVRDATIQRFEFTFEAIWKALKLYLDHQGLEASSPRSVLKQAFAIGLIESQEESDAWFAILEDRNLTTHVYRQALAKEIYNNIISEHGERLYKMGQIIGGLSWQ